jgi:hypothetical protein
MRDLVGIERGPKLQASSGSLEAVRGKAEADDSLCSARSADAGIC